MNSFGTLSLNYLLFTLVSSSILYAVFRRKLDASAIYFLIAELFMALAAGIFLLQNLQTTSGSGIDKAIGNFASLSSEVAILFSILSLTGNPKKRYFLGLLFVIGVFALTIEFVRDQIDLKLIVLMYTATQFCLFFSNYFICKYKLVSALERNQFLVLFRWLELALTCYAALRISTYFSDTPVVPRNSDSILAVAIFTIYVTLSTFRYMSYVALRMTWIDPINPSQNFLNRNLATVIEEKDRLLQSLIASNRVIGISALASSLAHQISQPLTAISLQAETSRRTLSKSGQCPTIISSLDEISHESGKLASLVNNLRQLFRGQNLQSQPVNLQRITNEILGIMGALLEAKKITLLKNYRSNPFILGDSIQIQQVLINIFNNAIESIIGGNSIVREIFITIDENEEYAIITIADTGTGISKELLPNIFDLHKTTKDNGLGVGLWLSQTIIDRHHGNITATTNTNGGATFQIFLPLLNQLQNKP